MVGWDLRGLFSSDEDKAFFLIAAGIVMLIVGSIILYAVNSVYISSAPNAKVPNIWVSVLVLMVTGVFNLGDGSQLVNPAAPVCFIICLTLIILGLAFLIPNKKNSEVKEL